MFGHSYYSAIHLIGMFGGIVVSLLIFLNMYRLLSAMKKKNIRQLADEDYEEKILTNPQKMKLIVKSGINMVINEMVLQKKLCP